MSFDVVGPFSVVLLIVPGGGHPLSDIVILGVLLAGAWFVTSIIVIIIGMAISPLGTGLGVVVGVTAIATVASWTGNLGLGLLSGAIGLAVGIVAGKVRRPNTEPPEFTRGRSYRLLCLGAGVVGIATGIFVFGAFLQSFFGSFVSEVPQLILLIGFLTLPPVVAGIVAIGYARTLHDH